MKQKAGEIPVSDDVWMFVDAAEREAQKLNQRTSPAHLALALVFEDGNSYFELATRCLGVTYPRLRRMLKRRPPQMLLEGEQGTIPSLIQSATLRAIEFGHPHVDLCHLIVELVCSSALSRFQTRRFLWMTYKTGVTCECVLEFSRLLHFDGERWFFGGPSERGPVAPPDD